jgi:hypothetical protein
MLPQGNAVPKIVYEAKQIIYLLGLEVEKTPCERMIAFYIMGLSMKNLRNALFMDLADSIVEKMTVMMRTAIEEKAYLKRYFGTFLSFII